MLMVLTHSSSLNREGEDAGILQQDREMHWELYFDIVIVHCCLFFVTAIKLLSDYVGVHFDNYNNIAKCKRSAAVRKLYF